MTAAETSDAEGDPFVKDRKLYYVYNFIGIRPEQKASNGLEPGKHVLGREFVKESVDERHATHGTAKLYIDQEVVAEEEIRTQPVHFALCGEGLRVSRDRGNAVSAEYQALFAFTGGRIGKVEVSVGDDADADVALEQLFAAAMARD